MYRRTGKVLDLVHPGGPFWRNRDDGAWSIPKGEMDEGEDAAEAALRRGARSFERKCSSPDAARNLMASPHRLTSPGALLPLSRRWT
jgi:predicted NUDIX family NTP pyrophosphohydrolase